MPTVSQLTGTSGSVTTTQRQKYPNPFFDLSKDYIPSTIKKLFKYCRSFFYKNEFINSVIYKLAEYPITDFIYEKIEKQETKDRYRELFGHHLKLKSLLIEIGLDYMTFGNCFVSANMDFKRYLGCHGCGEWFPFREVKKIKLKQWKFHGTCHKCNKEGYFKVDDKVDKHPNNLNFIRWAPENIDVLYDPFTGKSRYFYNITKRTQGLIQKNERYTLEHTPMLFMKALKDKKKIELNKDNLYHFKRHTLAEEDMGWGKPMLLPALSLIWYMQTLRRGNEAIAVEHIIPMRAIYPAAQGTMDPYSGMNLGKWRNKIEAQILNWRKDPNHVGIFPIPIGYQSLGGDARALMVTPELKFLEENIISSLGVPVEFVKGGASWTGSSISLRIVENHFLSYREQLLDFINYFVVPTVKKFLDYPDVAIKFKRFRMSDDSESKRIMLELAQLNKISDSKLLDEFGYDVTEDLAQRELEIVHKKDLMGKTTEAEAEVQQSVQILTARSQARAEWAFNDEKLKIDEEMFQEELTKEGLPEEAEPSKQIHMLALKIFSLPEAQQIKVLQELLTQKPITFSLVRKRMGAIQEFMMASMPQTVAAEQEAAAQDVKREQIQAKKVKPEKHTGQKRGTP